MSHFPLSGKLRTAFRAFTEGGSAAVWSLFVAKVGEVSRTMPGGLVRVGTCFFRAADEESRRYIVTGVYEVPERFATKRFIRRDIPVVEFGGSLGVVSCLLNRRLRDARRHVVVEANSELVPFLTENRDRNRCKFEIVYGAAGAQGTTVRIYVGRGGLGASAIAITDKSVEVPVVRLGEMLKERAFDRCALVCDIEGAEIFLIRAELATFQSHVETFVVEFHPAISGSDAVDASRCLLTENGFEQLWRESNTFVFRNTALS